MLRRTIIGVVTVLLLTRPAAAQRVLLQFGSTSAHRWPPSRVARSWVRRPRSVQRKAGADQEGRHRTTGPLDPDAGVPLKRFDFGFTLGGEFAISSGPRFFVVPSARFTQSMTPISKQSGTDAENRTMQLGVVLRRHR